MSEFPQLVRFYPNAGGTVNTNTPDIQLDWSIPVESNQFSDNTSRVKLIKLVASESNIIIPLSYISYDANLKRITLRPSTALSPDTSYSIILNKGVIGSGGRKSTRDWSWDFKTTVSTISTPNLLLPDNNGVNTTFPTFSWAASTVIPTQQGQPSLVTSYQIQISDNSEMLNPIVNTYVVSTTYTPSQQFDSGKNYYWRVRGLRGDTNSPTDVSRWTEIRSFYFGLVNQAHPTSQSNWDRNPPFTIVSDTFHRLSNQQNYPTIRITFSLPVSNSITISDYIKVESRDVLPRNDKRESYYWELVPGTFTRNANSVSFIPSSDIVKNKRYRFTVYKDIPSQSGLILPQQEELYFTSLYDPYYVDIMAVRARFLSAEQRIPDDLINFYIYQASLEATARISSTFSSAVYGSMGMIDYLKEPMVRDGIKLNSFGVLKWVEATATLKILQSILREELRNVGRDRKQGDFHLHLDADFLKAIEAAKKDAEQEIQQYDSFLDGGAPGMVASRMSGWSTENWNYDQFVWRESRRDDIF